jgi:3-methylfumaryl-CoA hydratase
LTAIDIEPLKGWIGRTETLDDTVTPRLAALFRATLEPHLAPTGEDAPLGVHWCLAPPLVSTGDLGIDGHPERGGFLPPIPLPRRMWAGGEIGFFDALRIGDHVERRSSIADLRLTEGRSGPLCFVAVRHEVSTERGLAIRERQDIVYRDAPQGQNRQPAPASAAREEQPSADLAWTVDASSALLFRYSALSFNSHRIHYDQPYATEVEGYPGLVVHGPLQATLLLNLAAVLGGGTPRLLRYRGVSSVFGGKAFRVLGARTPAGAECWSATGEGVIGMKAEAEW